MQNDRPDRYFIPDNLNDKRHLFHIPDRNLVETGIAELFIFYCFKIIPIQNLQVKIIVGAIVMILVGVVGIIGIKNESVTEFLVTAMKFHKKKRILHYRRCDQKNYDDTEETEENNERTESRAEELLKRIEDNAAKKIEQKLSERNKK
ncbi:MAG: hypothetical protein ACI4FX_02920 [Agathobacter sp.]